MSKRSQIKRITWEAIVLRHLRRTRHISMHRAGLAIGVTSSAISHYEQGRMNLPTARIPDLLGLYGYTQTEFDELVMVNTPDIFPLVKGALALVMLALALGQYPRLAHWAQSQAVQAMEWKEGLPYFFAATLTKKEASHENDERPTGPINAHCHCADRISCKLLAWAALLERRSDCEGYTELMGLGYRDRSST